MTPTPEEQRLSDIISIEVQSHLDKIRAEIKAELYSAIRIEVSRQFEGMSVDIHYDKLHGAP